MLVCVCRSFDYIKRTVFLERSSICKNFFQFKVKTTIQEVATSFPDLFCEFKLNSDYSEKKIEYILQIARYSKIKKLITALQRHKNVNSKNSKRCVARLQTHKRR